MRRTYAIVAFGLAGFFGVTACTTASPSAPPPPPQVTTQAAPQTTTQAAPQTTTAAAPQTTTQAAPQVSSLLPGAGKVTTVTDETFEGEVLESGKPVIVEYWAEWCGPCRRNAPILAEIAAEHADKITVAKLNIDDNPAAPALYGVEQIPTTDVFSNGQMVKRITGAKSKDDMLRELAEFI